MRILGVIFLFAAEILRANTIFYNVDFNKDTVNQPPAIGVGNDSPSGGMYTNSLTVVRSFGQLRNQPLLFSGGSIEFGLNRGGAPDYTLDCDVETHNLAAGGSLDLGPFVLAYGQMTAPDLHNYPVGWTDDQAHHLHLTVGVGNSASNTWSFQVDNNEPIAGTGRPPGFDLYDFFLSAYNVQAAIDNIVIGSTTNFVPLKAFFPLSDASGHGPMDRVARDAEGNFYCTAFYGGSLNEWGTVFKTDKHGNLLWVYKLDDNSGENPFGGVIVGDDGFLYGTAANDSIFKMSTDGRLIWSVLFTNAATGQNPFAGVIELRNKTNGIELYGTTAYGGAYGSGTVFKLDASRQLHVLHSFSGFGAPHSRLVLGDDGFLYGTTPSDTPYGTIFKISRSGDFFTNLFVFDGTNGGAPMAGLTKYGRNTFYGTTEEGGTNFQGTIFRITTSGVLTTLHSFGPAVDGDVSGPSEGGAYPASELVLGRDGNFYGTTTSGGLTNIQFNDYDFGTVFRISPAGDFQKLANFHGGDGSYPVGAMIEGKPGTFYGTAKETDRDPSGYSSAGTIFSFSAARPEIVIDRPSAAAIAGVQSVIFGKTKSDTPVTNVFYSLNGGSWLEATSTNGWSTWQGAAALQQGIRNTIKAYAVSAFGDRSRTNTLNFKW